MIARHRLRWRIQHWLEGRLPGLLTCAEFQETLDDYLDGALGRRARMMVDFHIRTCPACRRYVAAYGAVRAAAEGAFDGMAAGGGPEADARGLDPVPEELVEAIAMARKAEAGAKSGA